MLKTTLIALTLLLAGSAFVTAATPAGCDKSPATEKDVYVATLPNGEYMWVSSDTSKPLSFWDETNGIDGLQSQPCHLDRGTLIYTADTEVSPTP